MAELALKRVKMKDWQTTVQKYATGFHAPYPHDLQLHLCCNGVFLNLVTYTQT